jgi:hypothetical protein
MLSKTFTSGRIRRGDYNPESQQLDLHWDNKSMLAYEPSPAVPTGKKSLDDLFGPGA